MTDKTKEGQKSEGGCCGNAAVTNIASNGSCSTDKKASTPTSPTDDKAKKGGCGCA